MELEAVWSLRRAIAVCRRGPAPKASGPGLLTPPCVISPTRLPCRAGGDIAALLGIAKGSIFQHFGSKDGLFFEVYKKAVRSFPRYLDAPAEVRERGFFEVLRYWLVRTEHLLHEDWIPYRVSLLGNYGTDLTLKREINRFLMAEDPYGTVAFVRYGLQRGELLRELDQDMIVSILDWTMERFQDALLTEELDPGLFRRQGDPRRRRTRASRSFWTC